MTKVGDPLTGEERLADGVFGYSLDLPAGLYVPWVMAEHEGSGDVGRYLDSLPRDRRVVFPTIISNRLVGMLVRRGFVPSVEWTGEEWTDVMERVP